MELHLWTGIFAALIALAAIAWLGAGVRCRFAGWSWWHPLAFLSGIAVALGASLSALDPLGEEGFLTAHIAQHVILADLAAPLLLLGLPPAAQRIVGAGLERAAEQETFAARSLTRATSPVGALVLWAAATYVWLVPPLHRLAVPDGLAHALEHVSFLAFGLLIWLGAFDPRPTRDWQSGLLRGGLPWWARHVYAMSTRLAILPAAFAIWLASDTAYHPPGASPPRGISLAGDRERAASVLIGFEMLLAVLAVVLAFVFVSVHEGRQRDATRHGEHG